MKDLKFSKKNNWEPTSKQITNKELRLLLSINKRKVLFCYHDWIYWTFGSNSTRQHRICKKCFKKQKNIDLIKKSSIWLKDSHCS